MRVTTRNMHSEVVAEIYRGGGALFTSHSKSLAPYLNKRLLRKAGTEFFSNNKITDETMMELNKPIIPNDVYTAVANRMWKQ